MIVTCKRGGHQEKLRPEICQRCTVLSVGARGRKRNLWLQIRSPNGLSNLSSVPVCPLTCAELPYILLPAQWSTRKVRGAGSHDDRTREAGVTVFATPCATTVNCAKETARFPPKSVNMLHALCNETRWDESRPKAK